MVQDIDGGFDAALFIGYHARAGTRNAILDHTYADRIHDVRLNGKPVGELGLNAALAGVHGVPVALVSGDSAVATEAKDLLGQGVGTVIVKEAGGPPPGERGAPPAPGPPIPAGGAPAPQRAHVPFTLRAPVTLEVDFAMTIHADMAELCPGATRTAGRTVAFTHPEYGEVFRAWRTLLNLSAVV